MIDITKLNIGDKFYQVYEANDVMRQKRLTFTDEFGEVWYRYDRPRYKYVIYEYIYSGKVEYVISGKVEYNYSSEYDTAYHIINSKREFDNYRADDAEFWDNCFLTKEEAEEAAAKFAKEREENESQIHYTVSVVAPKQHPTSS